MQTETSTVQSENSVFLTTDVGHLILEELRFIREDMKQEMRLIADRIELCFQAQQGMKTEALKKIQNSPVEVTSNTDLLSCKQILDNRAQVLDMWGEKICEFRSNFTSNHQPNDIFLTPVCDSNVDKSDFSLKEQPLSSFDSSEHLCDSRDSLECDMNSPIKEHEMQISRRPMINKLFQPHSIKKMTKITFNKTLGGKVVHKCQLCTKDFASQIDLKEHMHSHSSKKSHKCRFCQKSFPRQGHLTIHMRTHTGERPYQCEFCNKAFSRLDGLKIHIRIHTGEKPYRCALCQKGFAKQGHLKRHFDSHANEGPCECSICLRVFSKVSRLKKHMETHATQTDEQLTAQIQACTAEKPYQCKFCGKAFSRSDALKVHIRTHTGEKPYQCELCQKGFVKTSHLKRHLKSHANEGPCVCPTCLKVFAKVSTLNRHMETHLDETDENGLDKEITTSSKINRKVESVSIKALSTDNG